ncbi:MAG TPA: nucleoside deaminase [Kofleriaceae bacterium]|nr:nucleoside deaminase [Kofleriaceae bacterium]
MDERFDDDDDRFLSRAIELARAARDAGEDPFGAVLVIAGSIVREASDRTIASCDPTAHAELEVIRNYCRAAHCIDLSDAVLYASAEPCAMCAGAIHWARISRLVFSVPQSALQARSGGTPKLGCDAILNAGRTRCTIDGGRLLDRGLAVFDGYTFVPKRARVPR